MYKIICPSCEGRGWGALWPKAIVERNTEIAKYFKCMRCLGFGFVWWMVSDLPLPEGYRKYEEVKKDEL